jgi:chromate reductase
MIIVISGTNRPNSRTAIVSEACVEIIKSKGEEVQFISLEDLNGVEISTSLFGAMPATVVQHQENLLIPNSKWILISPEYNGGLPGILKFWIDMLSVSRRNDTFKDKKIGLLGVSSGRAGNARGMEALTGMLNYLGSHIYPNKLPLSSIESLIDKESNKLNQPSMDLLSSYIDDIIKY